MKYIITITDLAHDRIKVIEKNTRIETEAELHNIHFDNMARMLTGGYGDDSLEVKVEKKPCYEGEVEIEWAIITPGGEYNVGSSRKEAVSMANYAFERGIITTFKIIEREAPEVMTP